MTWTEDLPEWTETGDEPSAGKKAEGWLPDEKPPAGWFNWLFNRTYACLVELRGSLEATAGKVLISGGVGEPPTWQDTAPPSSHTHGTVTNDGKIGTSANIPIITGTDGVLQAGSFGTTANTFCEGDDSRLSDARTPSNHNLIDTTGHPVSGLTTGHFLKATGATTYAFGAHGLSNTDVGAAASSHTHGDITNDGKIGTTEDLVIVTGASGVLTAKTAGTSDQFLRGDGVWAEPAGGGGLTDENKVQIRMFGKVI